MISVNKANSAFTFDHWLSDKEQEAQLNPVKVVAHNIQSHSVKPPAENKTASILSGSCGSNYLEHS